MQRLPAHSVAGGRVFVSFSCREARFRLCSTHLDVIRTEIGQQRQLLEDYIRRQPLFRDSFVPVELLPAAPPIACRMQAAAALTGVGPMAAVAGCVAQMAAEAAVRAGATEAVVENGGDIYLFSPQPVVVGLYAGRSPLADRLAFLVQPEQLPLSICSSSSLMGHSVSLGQCDLATVVAKDGALADAAATLAGNAVKTPADIDPALDLVSRIPGVLGVLLVKDDRVGLVGDLPQLVRQQDPGFPRKVTHHPDSHDPALPAPPAGDRPATR